MHWTFNNGWDSLTVHVCHIVDALRFIAWVNCYRTQKILEPRNIWPKMFQFYIFLLPFFLIASYKLNLKPPVNGSSPVKARYEWSFVRVHSSSERSNRVNSVHMRYVRCSLCCCCRCCSRWSSLSSSMLSSSLLIAGIFIKALNAVTSYSCMLYLGE